MEPPQCHDRRPDDLVDEAVHRLFAARQRLTSEPEEDLQMVILLRPANLSGVEAMRDMVQELLAEDEGDDALERLSQLRSALCSLCLTYFKHSGRYVLPELSDLKNDHGVDCVLTESHSAPTMGLRCSGELEREFGTIGGKIRRIQGCQRSLHSRCSYP